MNFATPYEVHREIYSLEIVTLKKANKCQNGIFNLLKFAFVDLYQINTPLF